MCSTRARNESSPVVDCRFYLGQNVLNTTYKIYLTKLTAPKRTPLTDVL